MTRQRLCNVGDNRSLPGKAGLELGPSDLGNFKWAASEQGVDDINVDPFKHRAKYLEGGVDSDRHSPSTCLWATILESQRRPTCPPHPPYKLLRSLLIYYQGHGNSTLSFVRKTC
jgi:hypothetical protein